MTLQVPLPSLDETATHAQSALTRTSAILRPCLGLSAGPASPPRFRGRFLAAWRPRAHTWGMQTAVTLTLNGEARAFDGSMTVAALLATLGLESRKVAVERNEEIVPRSSYAKTWLQSGDALEIVHFIGGG